MIQARRIWDRTDPGRMAGWALWLAFVVAALAIPDQFLDFAWPVIPRVQWAFSPEIQTRATLGALPHQILTETNSLLPPDARVLVVTSGTDVRHLEYTTYHRALYYLTLRPVWWLVPAPGDGTWESRWWHSAPLTESAISEYARAKNVDVILLLTNPDLFATNRTLARWQGARLAQFQDHLADTVKPAPPEFAPPGGHFRAVAALALFMFNGTLVVQILTRVGLRPGLVESLALSWCLGIGLATFLLLGSLSIGLSLANSLWVVTAAALAGAAMLCYGLVRIISRSHSGIRSAPPSGAIMRNRFPLSWQTLLLLSVLIFQLGYVALIALGQPLTFWDSWVTWSIKARALWLEQGLVPALFTDASRAVTHLDYPLLLPLAETGIFQLIGAPDDRFVGWLAVGFFVALVSLVYAAARTSGADTTRSLLAAAVVGTIAPIALLAAQNYADIPLAAYGILTAIYLLRWIERGKGSALAIALVGAACLAWTKREGFFLALSVSLACLILLPRVSRARIGALMCAAVSGLVAVGWAVWLAAQGTTNTDFLPLTPFTLIQNVDRVPPILFYFARELGGAQWAHIWISAGVILLLRLTRRAGTAYDVLFGSALIYLGTMSATFILSDYAPYTAHLASAGYRLIAHVTPIVVVWLALQRAPQTTPAVTLWTTSNEYQATEK